MWRGLGFDYRDVDGFCRSVHIKMVRELDYLLTPDRYVGQPPEADDMDF
jgi:type I restriction-modification system DNA methylase subunit